MQEPGTPDIFRWAAVFAAGVLLLACDENPPDATISQFDRPQDVALVCYDTDEQEPLPMECCRSQGSSVSGICSVGLPNARIYAFVTQTTPGEVAVVDLMGQSIVDQEAQIPYNSFIPVGGQPSDIAATWDGRRVFTANYETSDLSVIDVGSDSDSVSVIESPSLKPARSIPLEAPAARFVISEQPLQKRDRFAFVTQPTASRLAVVALNADDCPDPAEQPNGCLRGYLQIDSSGGISDSIDDSSTDGGVGLSDGGVEVEQGGVRVWSVIASGTTPSLFLAATNADFILEIDSDVLTEEALGLPAPGPLSSRALVRKIETNGFTTRAIALEPVLERWLYAIENEEGGVLAIDLIQGELAEVENDTFSIELPGRARSLTMLRLGESGEPDPLNFNGSFAIISTTTAGIFVIDVDDEQPLAPYPHAHAIRSSINLSQDSEDLPRLADRPLLTVGGEEISDEKSVDYAHFGDIDGGFHEDGGPEDAGPTPDAGSAEDAGISLCGPDDGTLFMDASDFGFSYRCDPSQWSREEWRLTWEGSVGISGAGVIDYDSSKPSAGTMTLIDESSGFCERGLWVRGTDTGSGAYPGDILVVTSEPTPANSDIASKCSKLFGERELVYQVVEVLDSDPADEVDDDHAIRISNNTEEMIYPSPLPTRECFGQAFSYEIRAFRHWVLTGSSSGHLHDGEAVATGDGIECGRGSEETEGRASRVFPSVPFENYYFAFTLYNGIALDDSDSSGTEAGDDASDGAQDDDIVFTFVTEGGYAPMVSIVGNNVTDITYTPDFDLVLVDQAGEGLILFDMLHSFGVIGNPVN